MKDMTMAKEWRTIQFFLNDDGVQEVMAEVTDPESLACSCRKFATRQYCTHTSYVRSVMEENKGEYAILIQTDIDDDEVHEAFSNSDAFRKMLILHAKVLVID